MIEDIAFLLLGVDLGIFIMHIVDKYLHPHEDISIKVINTSQELTQEERIAVFRYRNKNYKNIQN